MAMTQAELDVLLMRKSKAGDLAGVREAIAAGANLEASGVRGMRALHHAAREGHFAIAAYLLLKGARVDCRDADGEQPLHHAVRNFDVPMAAFLLENGADPAAEIDDGETPLDLAQGHRKVCALLAKWDDPEFRKMRRQASAAETIAAHWKNIAGRLPQPGPRI